MAHFNKSKTNPLSKTNSAFSWLSGNSENKDDRPSESSPAPVPKSGGLDQKVDERPQPKGQPNTSSTHSRPDSSRPSLTSAKSPSISSDSTSTASVSSDSTGCTQDIESNLKNTVVELEKSKVETAAKREKKRQEFQEARLATLDGSDQEEGEEGGHSFTPGIQRQPHDMEHEGAEGSDDERDATGGQSAASQGLSNDEAKDRPYIPVETVGAQYTVFDTGSIEHIIPSERTVTVKASAKDGEVLDAMSWLCLDNRRVIGVVAEPFGSVEQPLYKIVFHEGQIEQLGLRPGLKVFGVEGHCTFLNPDKLHDKGYDIGNEDRAKDADQEYSSDEDEKSKENKARVDSGATSLPQPARTYHDPPLPYDDSGMYSSPVPPSTAGVSTEWAPHPGNNRGRNGNFRGRPSGGDGGRGRRGGPHGRARGQHNERSHRGGSWHGFHGSNNRPHSQGGFPGAPPTPDHAYNETRFQDPQYPPATFGHPPQPGPWGFQSQYPPPQPAWEPEYGHYPAYGNDGYYAPPPYAHPQVPPVQDQDFTYGYGPPQPAYPHSVPYAYDAGASHYRGDYRGGFRGRGRGRGQFDSTPHFQQQHRRGGHSSGVSQYPPNPMPYGDMAQSSYGSPPPPPPPPSIPPDARGIKRKNSEPQGTDSISEKHKLNLRLAQAMCDINRAKQLGYSNGGSGSPGGGSA